MKASLLVLMALLLAACAGTRERISQNGNPEFTHQQKQHVRFMEGFGSRL